MEFTEMERRDFYTKASFTRGVRVMQLCVPRQRGKLHGRDWRPLKHRRGTPFAAKLVILEARWGSAAQRFVHLTTMRGHL